MSEAKKIKKIKQKHCAERTAVDDEEKRENELREGKRNELDRERERERGGGGGRRRRTALGEMRRTGKKGAAARQKALSKSRNSDRLTDRSTRKSHSPQSKCYFD